MKWLAEGPTPDYSHLLHVETVGRVQGPWFLLDGYISQSGSSKRSVFTFLRGVLVKTDDAAVLRDLAETTTYLGNWKVPGAGDDYYAYAGEVPWSRQFADYSRRPDGRAVRHLAGSFETFERGRYRYGPTVEVPVHDWNWESHHSSVNQVGSATFPAPALCEALGLVGHHAMFDLHDATREASLFRVWEEPGSTFTNRLTYLRADLLDRYLATTGQELVWLIWGERSLDPSEMSFGGVRDSVRKVVQAQQQCHARFLTRRELVHPG